MNGGDSPRVRVAVPGAGGKMGRMILKVISETPSAELVAAVEKTGSPLLGQDAGLVAGLGANGVAIQAELDEALSNADVLIDFTAPSATAWTVSRAAEHEVGVVIGTTGLGEAEKRAVWQASETIPIVLSANMSLGVNVLFGLIAQAARALGNDYDVEIVELHHRQKKDAPSGTALAMASAVAEALERDLGKVARYGREGQVGARTAEEIGVLAVRGGDIVGEHTAYFCGLGEAEKRAVWQASERIPIVLSANMSLGVNVLFGLIAQAARALGKDYDVEIVELHHRQKKDAPSGTALAMASVLAEALERDLGKVARYGREGQVGARSADEIGVLAVRGGDIVGEHTAYFCGLGERLEITHRASSRETFARGAVRAAEWLRDRDPGLYDMQDVLGLRR